MNTVRNGFTHPGRISRAALAILVGVWGFHCGVNLVLFKTAEVPPYYDAANHTNIALEIRDHYDQFEWSPGWLDELYEISSYYPPCYHFLAAVCLKIRPHTLDSARLPNLFFLGLLMLSVYLWGTRLFDSNIGLLAGILVSLFPVVHGLTREIYVDLAVLSWAAAGAFLVWESNRFQRKGIAFLFGVVCGFGLLTKWTFPVFIGLPVLWVFSEIFLPVSVGRFIGRVFKGHDEETAGLFRAGVFTIAWVGLLLSLNSIIGGTGSFLVPTGMSLAFLVLLIGTIREALRSPGMGEAWKESKRSRPPIWSCLLGIAVASIPALLIAGPWYMKHFGFIASEGSRVLTEAAKVRGMAEVQTVESMVYSSSTLESHQLRLVFWALTILSLGSMFTRRGRTPSVWLLGGTFCLSYLVMSSLWVKDPRYFTPAIYPLPILISWWLLTRNPSTRKGWVIGTLVVAFVGYANQVVGVPGLSKKIEFPTPFGQPLTLTGPAPYGDMLSLDGDWPHRQIVEGIQLHRDHVSHIEGRLEVPVLVDDGYLHAPALNCFAKTLGADIDFFNIAYRPDYRIDPGWTTRLLNVLRSPYFITKEEGDLGLDFVTRAYTPLLEKLFGEESGWGNNLRRLAVYHLPKGGRATLWKNQFPAAFFGERQEVSKRFANGVRVTGFRFSDERPFRSGQHTLLRIDWIPEPLEALDSLLEGTEFFLHLQDARDGRFIQGWNFPLSNEGNEVAEFQIRSGSPAAVLSTELIEPREDLLPGIYEWRLGLFRTDNLDKVALADPIAEIETSIPLGEPFVFEPTHWDWVNAEFEDRAALEVRDEIGSLFLESARFGPRSIRPGKSINLECNWAYEWLELEAPEEQDVRGFAYLLPVSATGVTGPHARTSWAVDANGQSGPGFKRWATETRMALPSDLPEGEWKLCVGVERPLYGREFEIREGDQSGRNAYALSTPLFVGHSDWETMHAEYGTRLEVKGARIREASPTTGANIRFEVAWRAESASSLVKTASDEFLFIHLFSEKDETYTQLESFPLFRKERIHHSNSTVSGREGHSFYEGILSGFTETYPFKLKEDLPPGLHRVEFGFFDPRSNLKVSAALLDGSTTTTLHLSQPIPIQPVR